MSPKTLARVLVSALALGFAGLLWAGAPAVSPTAVSESHLKELKPDEVDWKLKELPYWRGVLSEEQVRVCRQAGTERAFTGALLKAEKTGQFLCSSCGQALFEGRTKFTSGTGWPSFYDKIDGAVSEHTDTTYGMVRTEVTCSRCDAHLGHVFDDGPAPTGKRYCINSVCLLHAPGEEEAAGEEAGKGRR